MQLPPVHSVSLSEYFVSGNVIIHETAVIAPGVILEAAPDCQIIIEAGVCIGLGSVITAHAGAVKIQEQAAIAPGCLVIGPVTIGQTACLGSRSTIFQQDIDAQALIPPGSLLINRVASTQTVTASTPTSDIVTEKKSPSTTNPIAPIPSPWDNEPPATATDSLTDQPKESMARETMPSPAKAAEQIPSNQSPGESPPTAPTVVTTAPLVPEKVQEKPPVVGQVYINQLLLTLFPERRYSSS
jgi:carbon dioxide concentrating mechanism protein CcmN